MPAADTGRSCIQCNGAKRKCDRTTPACRLCRRKKVICEYPPRKTSNFVPLFTAEEDPPLPESNLLDLQPSSNFPLEAEALPELVLDVTDLTHSSLVTDPRAAWFTAPETFMVDHSPVPLPPNFNVGDLKAFVKLIDSWMRDWVTTGSNTFIHARLYEDYFPSCLQMAFTTFSAYINRTTATTDMVLRAVNDQATALVSEADGCNGSSNVLKSLAIVHALLAYQMIGLFDGDIRARHLAEARAPVIAKIVDRTLENASTALVEQVSTNELSFVILASGYPDERLWRSWIISESLRRTWLVAHGVSATYDGLKQGWVPCHGNVMLTAREGLWSAGSASLWAEMCSRRDVRFTGCLAGDSWFQVQPGEVDEFAKAILEVRSGKERFMRWTSGVLY